MCTYSVKIFQIKFAFRATNSTYNIQALEKSNSRTHRVFKLGKIMMKKLDFLKFSNYIFSFLDSLFFDLKFLIDFGGMINFVIIKLWLNILPMLNKSLNF